MVTESSHVKDSFGLTEHINKPTHELGQTPDLILSNGFPANDIDIVWMLHFFWS